MIRGLYTSATGMLTQMKKLDVVSNNIANADTTGFKKDIVVTASFSEELTKRLDDPKYYQFINNVHADQGIGRMSLGVIVDSVFTDFIQGGLKNTGSELDIALKGSGFMVVNVPDRDGNITEKYTRDGALVMLADGTLTTKEGYTLQGENGIIVIPPGEITIDDNGNIYSNEQYVDRIRIVNFENMESLRKYGENLYNTTEQSNMTVFTGTVVQGFLETSNVNIVKEMVDMITVSRAYEANQKMVMTADTIIGRAVNDIAKK